jgi:hypothetical protein
MGRNTTHGWVTGRERSEPEVGKAGGQRAHDRGAITNSIYLSLSSSLLLWSVAAGSGGGECGGNNRADRAS